MIKRYGKEEKKGEERRHRYWSVMMINRIPWGREKSS